MAMDLEDVLLSAGATVLGPAPTVPAALSLLAKSRPDAALLDLNLRGERSTPVAEFLQAAAIPFVLVTGYSRSQIEEPLLRDAPCVPKPIKETSLWAALERLLAPST